MKKIKILIIAVTVGFIGTTYNACSKFQTIDSEWNTNADISGSSTDNPSSANNSNSTLQNNEPSPVPTPMGTPLSKGWSNEPAGAKVVLDCPMNNLAECGIQDIYKSSQIVSDSTAPISAGGVLKSTLVAGNSTGGMQLSYIYPKISREMYVGFVWRTNPQFQGRAAGNKTFFMRG